MLPAVWLLPDILTQAPYIGFLWCILDSIFVAPFGRHHLVALESDVHVKVKNRLYQYRLCYRRKVSVLCLRAVSLPWSSIPEAIIIIRYVSSVTEKPEFIRQQFSAQYCNIFFYFFNKKRKKMELFLSRLDLENRPPAAQKATLIFFWFDT